MWKKLQRGWGALYRFFMCVYYASSGGIPMWAVVWDIHATASERILSIWTAREAADLEYLEQSMNLHYRGCLRIVRIYVNIRNGVEEHICDTRFEESPSRRPRQCLTG